MLQSTETRQYDDLKRDLLEARRLHATMAMENGRLSEEVDARTRELAEALQQQTAAADVLKVISSSAFDLQALLDTLVGYAARLCEADQACVFQRKGDLYHWVSNFGFSPDLVAYASEHPLAAGSHSTTSRVALEGKTIHNPDVLADTNYTASEYQRLGNYRTMLGVPLLREGSPMGVFILTREKVRPFTERQIGLVQTFADQAVIAIENVRLLDEARARTRDLEEALAQQKVTADVLKVISRSTFSLDAVLNTLVQSMRQLCSAPQGMILLRKNDRLHMALQIGYPDAFERFVREGPLPIAPNTGAGRAAFTRRVVHIADVLADADYGYSTGQQYGRYRAMLSVPMLREGEVIGVFSLGRPTPGLFTSRQVDLVQTFADQAVIAIENVRLFVEVQARTKELQESLQQQTATADVLKVISRSAFDLQKVLDTLVESAATLCEAEKACIFQRRGELYHWESNFGFSNELVTYAQAHPFGIGGGSTTSRVVRDRLPIHIPDVLADPDYKANEYQRLGDYRTMLGVPLLRDGEPVGVFIMTRRHVHPFNARQIELLQTFSDQAVIAIENARLFEEVQARTRELQASLDDLHKAQDRLVQSEKLASLGQLTAGIAHEIKNPLNFVNNFAALSRELLEELCEPLQRLPEEAKADADDLIGMIDSNLEKVVSHGKRADSIVKNMLLHSREGSGERTSVNINAMVEEALNLGYHGARAEKPGFNVTLEKDFDPLAGAANMYLQEVTRVLLNLISNGFYAAAAKAQAEALDPGFEPVLVAATRDRGDAVEIRIRDNGTGVPDNVKDKIFNPFFTTKPAGEGTGLGLSISHDIIVKQHGGTINVDTSPGAFTEFTIVLPRAGSFRASS